MLNVYRENNHDIKPAFGTNSSCSCKNGESSALYHIRYTEEILTNLFIISCNMCNIHYEPIKTYQAMHNFLMHTYKLLLLDKNGTNMDVFYTITGGH